MANIKDFYPSIDADSVEGNVTGNVIGDVQRIDDTDPDNPVLITVVDNDAQDFFGDLQGNVDGTTVAATTITGSTVSAATVTASTSFSGSLDGNVINGGSTVLDKSTGTLTGELVGDVTDGDNIIVDVSQKEFKGAADMAANTNADDTTPISFWAGTQAQYDALSDKDTNTLYLIH